MTSETVTAASGGFAPARRLRLPDQVVAQLKEQLATGRLQVGDKLPSEPELMRQLGVGRTTVREAVRALAHEGILVVRQGDGTYVRSAEPDQAQLVERLRAARVVEVFEVRRGLELETCRLAAQRRSAADLKALGRLLDRLRDSVASSDMATFLAADIELHRALAASTANPLLIELYVSFGEILRSAIGEVIRLPGVMEACLDRHERLLDALRRRDVPAAEAVAAAYLDQMASALRAIAAGS